jgi:ubiquitin C-terminal hydrolase
LRALKSDLKERRPNIKFGNGQESAHEVFILLLDMMEPVSSDTEYCPLLSSIGSPITKLFLHKCEWDLFCSGCKKSISKKVDYGVIFDMHHIDWYSGEKNTPGSFSKLIKQHISQVDGSVCPHCSGTEICRIYNLKRIPEIVFCSFNVYYQQNRQVRYFPPYLEFNTFKSEGVYTFKLVSQIEHSGTLNGGHYWAKCLRNNGVYELNDMCISPTTFQSTPHTYIVVYHIE